MCDVLTNATVPQKKKKSAWARVLERFHDRGGTSNERAAMFGGGQDLGEHVGISQGPSES